MNKFSILHISDIHKIEDVTYLSLLNSIKKDMANWEVNVLFSAPGNQHKCLPLWQKTKVTKLCQ